MLASDSSIETSGELTKRLGYETTPIRQPDKNRKPPLASAKYEKKGTTLRLDTIVRPHIEMEGVFTFETSAGEIFHGNERQVAGRFFETDRRLQDEGFSRMNYSNLSGGRRFNLG